MSKKTTQGEMIDNIENNMRSTCEYVEQAKAETKQAVVYQKAARRVRNLYISRTIIYYYYYY